MSKRQDIQKGSTNVARGDDAIGVQAGQVGGGKHDSDRVAKRLREAEVRVQNIRSGNARVGKQADSVDRIEMTF